MKVTAAIVCTLVLLSSGVLLPPGAAAADRQLLWGDTHLHTTYSFDAFLNNNLTADPDAAYRFARGQPVIHPWHRARMQLRTPLDFLVVSDHAEFLGRIRDIYHNGLQEEDAGLWDSIVNWYTTRTLRRAVDAREGPSLFRQVLPQSGDPVEAASVARNLEVGPIPPDPDVSRSAWGEIVAAAEAHNQPGTFTTLLGWEWSALPGGANLHRVVVTDAGASQARAFQPFSSLDSPYPEDLWQWLEKKSETTGARFLAIPHNSNISKGFMFSETTLRGEPVDAAYARQRMRWERIVEVTQIKGDSEAHFLLSPEDEFAGFEVYPFYIQQGAEDYVPRAGDYARSGLKTGLELEASLGVNPFRFGMIGSTDSHTGLSTADENNFGGKMATDSTPETKLGPVISGGVRGWTMSASGLAAVWAEENTREAIFDAMQRRETYATTGPRIRVRFFGGWDFTDADLEAVEIAAGAPGRGVPMGGELSPPPEQAGGSDAADEDSIDGGSADGDSAESSGEPGSGSLPEDGVGPTFLVVAHKDPGGANLDRVQIVKGWLDEGGTAQERVVDVVWAGDREPGADGRLPPVGNTVDRNSARYSNSIGAAELAAVWRDPAFDAAQSAFYYVRVIEIPTPRHAQFDAAALGMQAPTYGPSVIQERAYTSPIWYRPTSPAVEAMPDAPGEFAPET